MSHIGKLVGVLSLALLLGSLLLPLSFANSPPPPPPPPCPTRTAGCYDTSDNKGESGSLASDTFGFYLSESAYIPGGCSASTAKTVEQAKVANPDDHVGACACIAGADFDTQAEAAKRCCGDDTQDCGVLSRNALCAIDPDYRNSRWILPAAAKFDIIYVGCQDKEKVFDGSSWTDCTSFSKRSMGPQSREYLCNGEGGQGSVAECCGPSTCLSKTNGKRLQAGGSISSFNTTHYCATDRKFATDLDIKDQASCDNAKNPDGAAAGFKWTGTKCCSEAEDRQGANGNGINEYYNDETGGCWDSKPVMSIDFIDTKHDVVNFGGEFHGCATSKNIYKSQNDAYLSLTDKHTGGVLVSDDSYCTTDPNQEYYCSFHEEWRSTGGEEKTSLKSAPTPITNNNLTSQSECCAPTQCWDGTNCISDQSPFPTSENALPNHRCMSGNWIDAKPKTTPTGEGEGFCPNATQCLVNPSGNAADNNDPTKNPQCIASGQYIRDNLCFEGNWSARTTAISLQLLDFASSQDFILFCDKTETTLTQLEYNTPSGKQASTYFGQNANNVCVLSTPQATIIGTSFNTPLTTPSSNPALFDLFGVQGCNVPSDGTFHQCDAAGNLWYNKKLESIIFSKTPLDLDEPNLVQSFFTFLKNPLANIVSSMRQKITTPSFPISSFGDRINTFNRLYIAKKGTKSVFGVLQDDTAVVEYRNLQNAGICDFAKAFTLREGGSNSGIECKQDGSTTYLLLQGSQLTTFRPEQAWGDVTAKVRLG